MPKENSQVKKDEEIVDQDFVEEDPIINNEDPMMTNISKSSDQDEDE